MVLDKLTRLLPLFTLIYILSGCSGDPSLSALIPAGPVAQEQLSLINLSLAIMIGVTVVVFVIFTYVLIRYRQRPGDEHIPEQVEGNKKLELTWTIIPIILLIIIAVPTVASTLHLGQGYPDSDVQAQQVEENAALRVNVIAHLFWWEFEYPDLGIVTANHLYIPTDERIYFQITSEDVIHSFWVPPLGGKADANPGMSNALWLEADEPGTYEGRCAELCGEAHALMNFRVTAVKPAEFEQWVQSNVTFEAEEMETEAQSRGRDLFANNCLACHSLESDIRNPMGPSMVGYANRTFLGGYLENNAENLAAWIKNPDELKSGALMPSADQLGLTDDDISALVEYLGTLSLDNES